MKDTLRHIGKDSPFDTLPQVCVEPIYYFPSSAIQSRGFLEEIHCWLISARPRNFAPGAEEIKKMQIFHPLSLSLCLCLSSLALVPSLSLSHSIPVHSCFFPREGCFPLKHAPPLPPPLRPHNEPSAKILIGKNVH